MGWQGDWIPVIAAREHASLERAAVCLRRLGYESSGNTEWRHAKASDLSVHYGRRAPSEEMSLSEVAGWFLVRRVHDETDEALARATARALAETLESVVVQADGMGFVLHDGREAESLTHALVRLVEVDDDEDAPISIDWSDLPGPSLAAFVIVFRGDHPFSARELAGAVRPIPADVDLDYGAAGARWKELRAIDPSLAWTLLLERGHGGTRVPFYLRAHFDYGERDTWMVTGEKVLVTADDMRGVVNFARAFTENVAPALKLTAIDIETR